MPLYNKEGLQRILSKKLENKSLKTLISYTEDSMQHWQDMMTT